MIDHGKTHKQTIGAVKGRLAGWVCVVLNQQRGYRIRDHDGQPLFRIEAGCLVREHSRVAEEVRSLRRHCHRPTKKCIREESLNTAMKRWEGAMTREAVNAHQQGSTVPTRPGFEDDMLHEVL